MQQYQYQQSSCGHDVHVFQSYRAGEDVLVFGAIHGDEICGPKALNKIIDAFKTGDLHLTKGSITIIPVCNLQAYKENKRFIDENLNRVFGHTDDPQSLEASYANILLPYVERADVLIDLHSTAAAGAAFVFDDQETELSGQITACLPVPYILTGWDALYPEDQGVSTITAADKYQCTGVCIENGQHIAEDAMENAYLSVMSILSFLKMVEGGVLPSTDHMAKRLHMTEVLYRKDMSATFSQDWQNFSPIKKDEVIASCPCYGTISAPYDGYLIMPKDTAPIDEEWLYFAREISV